MPKRTTDPQQSFSRTSSSGTPKMASHGQGGGQGEVKTPENRPKRAGYSLQNNVPIKVSFVTLPDSSGNGERICLSVGKELYFYKYKGFHKDSEVQPKSSTGEVLCVERDLSLPSETSSTGTDRNSKTIVVGNAPCETQRENSILEENSVPWPSEEQSIGLIDNPAASKFPREQKLKCARETPKEQSLSLLLTKTSMQLTKSRLKIRTLLQSNRRLRKKIASLKDLLCDFKQQNFSLHEFRTVFNSMSTISKEMFNHKLNKKNQYSDKLRSFASTLYSLSPSAYLYIRKKLDTALPHPRTLAKWDTMSFPKKDPEPVIDPSPDPDKNESVPDLDTSQVIVLIPLAEHDNSN